MILDIPLEGVTYEIRVPADRWHSKRWHHGGLVISCNPETGPVALYEHGCCEGEDIRGKVVGRSVTLLLRVEGEED